MKAKRYRVYQITTRVWESVIEVDPDSENGQELAKAFAEAELYPDQPTFVMDHLADIASHDDPAGEGVRTIEAGRLIPVDKEPEEIAATMEHVSEYLSEYGRGAVHWVKLDDDTSPVVQSDHQPEEVQS